MEKRGLMPDDVRSLADIVELPFTQKTDLRDTYPFGLFASPMKDIGRRADDMFIIRGINVYPSKIETALLKVEEALPHYQILLTREKGLDNMEVRIEVTLEFFGDTVGALEQLQNRLTRSIETTVGLRASVRLVQPRTIERSEGKAKRVIDQRNL
jgi:phenylacetate-CoA ligase